MSTVPILVITKIKREHMEEALALFKNEGLPSIEKTKEIVNSKDFLAEDQTTFYSFSYVPSLEWTMEHNKKPHIAALWSKAEKWLDGPPQFIRLTEIKATQ